MMVRRLPASLRWALMLPLAFLGMSIVHLAYGAFMPRLLTGMHDEGGVSIVLSSLFIWYKYYVFVVAMVGTALFSEAKTGLFVGCCGNSHVLVRWHHLHHLHQCRRNKHHHDGCNSCCIGVRRLVGSVESAQSNLQNRSDAEQRTRCNASLTASFISASTSSA